MREHVCHDVNGDTEWSYDTADQNYYRLAQDGTTLRQRIHGKYLPDPWLLWQKRSQVMGVAPNSDDGLRVKPQDATFALWEHWSKVNA